MQCLLASELMSLSLDGLLDRAEQQELDDHIAACTACRAEWERVVRLDALFAREPMLAPPTTLKRDVMRTIARRERTRNWARGGLLALFAGLGFLLLAAVPVMLLASAVFAHPALVQAAVRLLSAVTGVARSMAGALILLLRTLVGGMNWILLPGTASVVVGMILVWWSMLNMPHRLATARVRA